MNQTQFDKWAELTKKAQAPFKAIAELNVKTLQELNYLKPEELIHLKKPEELLEKQMNLAIENGQKALDYIQKSFYIFEQAMLTVVQDIKNKTDIKKEKID